jgi:hypothetical protein
MSGDAIRILNQFLHPAARDSESRVMISLCAKCSFTRGRRSLLWPFGCFTDRDADDDNPNRGSCLVFGVNEAKSSHEWFSIAHVSSGQRWRVESVLTLFGREKPKLLVDYRSGHGLLMCAPELTPPERVPALAADSNSLLSRR